MAVCARDNAEEIDAAIRSVIDQTSPPGQIVVVVDGVVDKCIDSVLMAYERMYPDLLTLLRNKENRGPAYAWNRGVEASRYDLVARMDSDDISRPERFEVQEKFMQSHPDVDVLGGYISEFSEGELPGSDDRVRRVPHENYSIISALKKRNSINHVTVVFRKESVIKSGGYLQIDNHVDYYLWVRMAMKGMTFRNVDDVLVDVRSTSGQMLRRGGYKYILSELNFYLKAVQLGFITPIQALKNMLIRLPFRAAPLFLRRIMYKKLRRH